MGNRSESGTGSSKTVEHDDGSKTTTYYDKYGEGQEVVDTNYKGEESRYEYNHSIIGGVRGGRK